MKLIIKYLKPFIISTILIFALLFVQARMDLNLPNYMSNIINIGIQKSGIEEVAPIAISENGLKLIKFFMTSEEATLVSENYKLIEVGNTSYLEKYPLLETSNIYILENSNSDIDASFGNATATMFSYFRSMNTSGETSTSTEIDFSKIYQLLPVLPSMSSKIEEARINAIKIDSSLKLQMASSLTKSFYTELKVDISSLQNDYIISQGLVMLLIALIGGIASILVGYFASKIAASIAMKMRHDVFSKVMTYTNNEVNKFGSSSLITRTTNDISQVQQLIFMGFRMLAYAPIIGIGGVLMALEKSSSMSWIIALAVATLLVFITIVFIVAIPKFKKFQSLIDRLNLVARENLNGLMVIRAFGSEKFEAKRFNKANKDISDVSLFIGNIMSLLFPAVNFIMSAVIILIVWVSAHQIADSTMQIGDMMAFMQYTMQIIMSFVMVTIMFILIPRAFVSIKRINEVLDTDPLIKDKDELEEFDGNKKGLLEFKNVSFQYNDAEENVLDNISFTARKNEITAFIGSTGSGKSTLINLIPRFYDVTEGEILFDGVNIKNVSTKDLRNKIGYIPQKGVLLSGTILSNMQFGKEDASTDEIKEALDIAQADFVDTLENKYESNISQGATNISGGQKQRLSIARALVKKPELYIFDDTFSALDFKTDTKLRKALKKNIKDATILIVAQRVSTIMQADQIVVLDQGKVVGIGKHDELLKTCPTYLEIATSQLSKEEL